MIYIFMNYIKGFAKFEAFSIKGIDGKNITYCHDCGHSFDQPGQTDVKIKCPSCGVMGFISKDLAYLKPIARKF